VCRTVSGLSFLCRGRFLPRQPPGSSRISGRSNGCRLETAGRCTVGWRQLVPFLGDGQMQSGPIVVRLTKPAKRYKWRSPAALTNMAANPPSSRILPLFSQEVLGGLAMWASVESCWETELSFGYILWTPREPHAASEGNDKHWR
jgi:hypothetical protein